MTEKDTVHRNDRDQKPDIPEAVVTTRKRQISIVWIVPIVAAIIGAWLVYKTFSERGPTITITFKTADGLEEGKTNVRYKDVELGRVTAITISPDLGHVVVEAQLVKQAEKFLSENTRFWVVRARVAAGEVSGLRTIFSGAYIGMDPGKPGEPAAHFKGLDSPPVVTTDLPGQHFTLKAARLGSLDIGAPVYYRQIKVGQVIGYKLEDDGQAVAIKIFINAPIHKLVHKNTRFWNASGIDISLNANGIKIDTESLVSIIIGGIAFDTPLNLEPGGPAGENEVFKLYENYETIFEKTYARKNYWILNFDGSVRGLKIGAPVEFRGIPIGQVLDINLEFDYKKEGFVIPVLIETEPDRLSATGGIPKGDGKKEIMDYLVTKGLRAQLKTGSLLTGQLLVDLDMHPTAPPAKIDWSGRYPTFPTVPTSIDEITTNLTHLLKKLEKLPIEQIGNDLRDSVSGVKELISSAELETSMAALKEILIQTQQFTAVLNEGIAPELKTAISSMNSTLKQAQKLADSLNAGIAAQLEATLKQAQSTLQTISGSVSKDAPLYRQLNQVMKDLGDAARSIRVLADYLERHPDALIYGKGRR